MNEEDMIGISTEPGEKRYAVIVGNFFEGVIWQYDAMREVFPQEEAMEIMGEAFEQLKGKEKGERVYF